ncbi:uncharacterized protein LOC111307998 [Durio zibethinus]|uniref:Uncharacterized protein LOC111307998 n=1 Tax=Durio zibethinus TaxID=66656 RepID=A0A6P6AB23_DURZI|nr:uncharacterized protein LOC111307998 [Durio zibethinus]
MASSPLNQKSNFHACSNSLPSRRHPLIPQIDEHIYRLKSNEAASSSSSSIGQKLSGLRDLYELFDSLLQLPLSQNSFAQQCNDKQVNELLNGSLRLLDVCGLAKDALMRAKEDTQELQSILGRRRGDEAGFTDEAKAYLASRKKAKKLINKSLRDLKSKCDLENEVEVTIRIGTKMQPKSSKWSFLSKLMHSKRVTCGGEATGTNEFEKVDAVFGALIGHQNRKSSYMSTENAQIELQKLASSIQDLEDGVELTSSTSFSLFVFINMPQTKCSAVKMLEGKLRHQDELLNITHQISRQISMIYIYIYQQLTL